MENMCEMRDYINRLSQFHKPDLENVTELTSAEYFYDPHSHFTTHEQVISDRETIDIYRGWIEDNSHIIKDKVVLDVGCGTGLFSMLAAKAGAARVISVEWSSIAELTKRIVKANHLEHVITVIKGTVEKIQLPSNIHQVDVIISLWMGYSLFQGGRIKAVLHARDKWLKPNGYIIPDLAQLYISGISDDDFRENCMDWWKNVYGYDMSCLIEDALKPAHYCILPPNKICTNKCEIRNINLKTQCSKTLLENTQFQITAKMNDFMQGFCTYFTVGFSADVKKREINTDPILAPKLWGQTVYYFKDYIVIKKREKIKGSFSFFNINNDSRLLGVIIGFVFSGKMDKRRTIKEFVLQW